MSAAPPPADTPPLPTLTYRQTLVILSGLFLCMFLAALDQTAIAIALPAIAADLAGAEYLSQVVAGYLLTATAATPIYGKLSDLHGRKRMLQVAIAIFLAAAALSGLAGDMIGLVLARALQGIGGVGPVMGGIFVDNLSWRWIFWVNIPIGLAALYMAQRTLQGLRVKGVRHRIDYTGAVLIVAAVCTLILALSTIGRTGRWTDHTVLVLLAAATVLVLLCVLRERMALNPILPLRLFANHTFVVANTINVLMSACNIGRTILIPLYLQITFRLPTSEAGLLFIPYVFTGTFGAMVSGRIMAITGRYRWLPIFGLFCTSFGMAMMVFVGPGTPLGQIAALIALAGIGGGFAGPVTMVAVQNTVDVRDLGTSTASISFFCSLGGAMAVALMSAVLIAQMNLLLLALLGAGALGPEPGLAVLRGGITALEPLAAPLQAPADRAVDNAFAWSFGTGALISFLTLAACFLLHEAPLKTTSGRADAAARECAP